MNEPKEAIKVLNLDSIFRSFYPSVRSQKDGTCPVFLGLVGAIPMAINYLSGIPTSA